MANYPQCAHCGAPLREIVGGACRFCQVPVAPDVAARVPDLPATSGHGVLLVDPGRKKINVIKVVRELTGQGLKEAKDLVDGAVPGRPQVVVDGLSADQAQAVAGQLAAQGAEVRVST